MQFETFFARNVSFAIVVGVVAAGLRTGLVDAAAAIWLQMGASALEQQIPGAFIPESMDALVRHLPQQVREILFGARGVDVLSNIGATGCALAGRTFVYDGLFHACIFKDG